jgi:hypothetical protein
MVSISSRSAPARLLAVGDAQLVEGDGAEAGITHIGRDRSGAVGRAERAGDEAAAAVILLRQPRCLMRQFGAGLVQLIGDLLHAVVGLRDGGGGKRIGADDIGTGAEVSEMNVAHRVRPAQVQQVVVAAQLAVPGVEAGAAESFFVQLERLDHGAHGAVEHQDALLKRVGEGGAGTGRRSGHE